MVIAPDVPCSAEIKSLVERTEDKSTATVSFALTVYPVNTRFVVPAVPPEGTKLIVIVASVAVVLVIKMFLTIVDVEAGAV